MTDPRPASFERSSTVEGHLRRRGLISYTTRRQGTRLWCEAFESELGDLLRARDSLLRGCIVAELMLERFLRTNSGAPDKALLVFGAGRMGSALPASEDAYSDTHVLQALTLGEALPDYVADGTGTLNLGEARLAQTRLRALVRRLREGSIHRELGRLAAYANLEQPTLTQQRAADRRYEGLAALLSPHLARHAASQP